MFLPSLDEEKQTEKKIFTNLDFSEEEKVFLSFLRYRNENHCHEKLWLNIDYYQ
jgi:hypothetical protein